MEIYRHCVVSRFFQAFLEFLVKTNNLANLLTHESCNDTANTEYVMHVDQKGVSAKT